MMKVIEFKYRKEKSRILGEIYRPIVKVQLQGDECWISEFMYVDSGADFTLIPYKLGRFLGFTHLNAEIHDIQGVCGTVPVIFKTANMRLGEYIFRVRIAWSQLEGVPLLVGRLDVFDRFDVIFKQNDKKVMLEWLGEENGNY